MYGPPVGPGVYGPPGNGNGNGTTKYDKKIRQKIRSTNGVYGPPDDYNNNKFIGAIKIIGLLK